VKEWGRVYLQELNLLVFTQQKFRGLTPVRGVLPTVLDQAGRVTIGLGIISAQFSSRI